MHFDEVNTVHARIALLSISALGRQMETLYSQADSFSAHEAIACVCESKEWWKSGESFCQAFSRLFFTFDIFDVVFFFNKGTKVIRSFLWYLNPRQVFDLTQGGPREG